MAASAVADPTLAQRSSQGTLASSPLHDDGDDKGSVSAEDKEQARPAEEGEPIEKIKINHRWTIYDPFNFGPPPPPPKTMDDAETIRLASANFLSKFTFWWIRPLLVLGYKRELQATDLPKMDPTRESGYLADKFEINFDKRRKAVEDWNRALDDGTYKPTALVRARWRLNEMLGFGRRDGRRNVGLALALSDTFFWEFWSAGIFKVLADAAQVTSPLVMRQIIRQTQKAWAAKQAGQPLPPVNPAVGAAIGLFLMQIWVSYFQANTFARSGQVGVQARAALIASLYRKAFRMNGKARTTLTNAKLTSHISTSISRIDWASTFFHFSWTTLIQLAEVIIILLCTIGVSSLAGIALVLVALPMQTYAMRQLFKGRQQAQVFTDERIKSISELLSGIRIVKFFAWEKPILDKVATSRKRELGKVRKLLAIRAANQAIAMSIPLLASVLVFAVYSLTGHSQNPAEIWTSLALLNLLRAPLMMLPNSLSTMTDALSALTNLVPVFVAEELPEKLFEVDENAELALEVRDATFGWETSPPPASGAKGSKGKSGKKASKAVAAEMTEKDDSPSRLEDINLRVPRGQLLCIVGSVGSGKSSLLQGCIGEMRRVKGEVVFGGRIAYCAQSAWILNTTVRENIIFGRDFDENRYWNCIRAACLLTDLDQLPSGDMTEIGEKGITLSGGQRQRVSIARTLYYDADIALLDDPLSAVDAHVGNHIFQHAIQGMLKDKTVILVTHALQYLAHADNVIVMENGRIAEQGSFDALLNSNSAFSRFAHEYGVVNTVAQTDEKAQLDDADEVMDEGTAKTKTEEINPEMAAGKKYGSSRPLVQKEEQATGSIKLSTWYTFAKAANGLFTVPAVLLSLTLMSASQILSQFALTWWQNNNWGLGSNTYIGVYASLGISSALFTFLLGLATVWFGTAAARTLHNMALKQVIQAPMTYFDQTPLGRIMNRFSKDTDNLDSRLNDSLRMALATVAQIAAAVIMISIVYPYFLIPVAAIAYLFVTTSNFYRPSARAIKRHDATLRSFLFAWFGESLTGLPTIRAFGEQERFLRGNEKYIDLENRAWFLTPINQRFLATLIDTLGALLVLVVAIVAVAERTTIPPSKTGLILSVTLAMQQAVTMLVRQTAEVENNMASIERFEFYAKKLPQEAALDLPSTAPPPEWPSQGRISMRNVELRYRPELPAVIRNFNLEIGAGEKVGVVGRTGAGKSTLTQALFRIIELSKGTIEIDGIDIRTLGLTQLRERLSIIPQEPLLFNGTIRTNLDPFGLYDDARLWDALRRSWLVDRTSGTDNVAEASRFTLDTPIEDEGANLSVGERSLVSLARALVRDSKIVCLDEATASVDLETDARIQATIRSEFRDKTLLTIAHRIQTILGSDRILVMDRGEISAFAPPLELFDRHDGIFYSLCVQSNISRDDILKAQAS